LPASVVPPQSSVHSADLHLALQTVMRDGVLQGGAVDVDVRLESIKQALQPIFAAAPKTRSGNLDHATTRYVAHRYFEHKYGIHVRGLAPDYASVKVSLPMELSMDQVPSYLQHLLQQKAQDGLSLKMLAAFVAILEHFIREDAVESLTSSYLIAGAHPTSEVAVEKLDNIMDIYTLRALSGAKYSRLETTPSAFPSWPSLQRFTRKVQAEILEQDFGSEPAVDKRVTFTAAQAIIVAIMERFGSAWDSDCRSMAQDMAQLDPEGIGRVQLADFYGLGGQLNETAQYLLDQGAAEEYDVGGSGGSEGVRVVIPNYLQDRSKCVDSTAAVTFCCRNQCEDLLQHLERSIAAPSAPPDVILELLASLPSSWSVSVPRHMPESLRQQLQEIAQAHSGQVPLHGRHFAQFMHHAYPRECPNPASSGSSRPMVVEDWKLATGDSTAITVAVQAEDIEADVVSLAEQKHGNDFANCAGTNMCTEPQNWAEELNEHQEKRSGDRRFHTVLRSVAMIVASISLASILAGTWLRIGKVYEGKVGEVLKGGHISSEWSFA